MSNNKAPSFELVVHIPEVDCRRRIKLDPNMTAGELIDFIVSRVEYLVRGDKFVLYCDTRKDRSQLYFPENEVIAESGVHSGDLIVLRHQPVDVYLVPDQTGTLTYAQAMSMPGKVSMKLDFYAPLRDSIAVVSQRMGLSTSGQEYQFLCANERISRPLKIHISLAEQRVNHSGNVLLVQSVNVLLKQTLDSLTNVAKFGWLQKKSVKAEKTTKNKKRYCVLTDTAFYYFKNNSPKSNPQGVVPLDYYHLVDKTTGANQFILQHAGDNCFCTRLANFVMAGETLEETDEWKMAIRDQCDYKPLFGVSLVEVGRALGGEVPLLVKSCVQELMKVAGATEGIFRLSGAQNEVDDLCTQYRRGRAPNLTGLSVHVVAGVLKTLLREMPNPLLTTELYNDVILAAQDAQDEEELVDELAMLILHLPTVHQKVLEMLLRLLYLVHQNEETTLMSAKNLALALTPSILVPPSRDPLPSKEQVLVVTTLISRYPDIYANMPDMCMEEFTGSVPKRTGANRPAQVAAIPLAVLQQTVGGAKPMPEISGPQPQSPHRTGGLLSPAQVRSQPMTVGRAGGASLMSSSSPVNGRPGVATAAAMLPSSPQVSKAAGAHQSMPPTSVAWGVIKYNYNARSEKEVTVSANTECILVKDYPNGWTLVEVGNQKGLVPTSYIEVAVPPSSSSPAMAGRGRGIPAKGPALSTPPPGPKAAGSQPIPVATKQGHRSGASVGGSIGAAIPVATASPSMGAVAPAGGGGGGGAGGGGDWRKEFEALKSMLLTERERNDRLEEEMIALRETHGGGGGGGDGSSSSNGSRCDELEKDVLNLKKEVERLRLAVTRLGKQDKSSEEREDTVSADAVNRLEEEIEVLDTRIEEEESARRGLEGAIMSLVAQLQQDLDDERDKVARLQEIIDAWSAGPN